MIDNIFTRIYGDCADYCLRTGNYNKAVIDARKRLGALCVVMPSCHMRRCANMILLKNVYDCGGSVVLTDIKYCDIEYLHSILCINVPIGYTESDPGSCKPTRALGYYGVCKAFNKSINQFYYKIENVCNISRRILKGEGVDEVTSWLNDNAKNIQNESLNSEVYNKANDNDLTKIASAQNITFKVQGENDLPLYMSDVRPKANTYAINVTIYAAHSLADGSDYYYIEQEGVYNFNNSYFGIYRYNYEGAYSKVEELYCSDLVTDCYLGIDPKYVDIMRLAPQTTEGESSITSGISWNLGGGVSVSQGGASVSFEGGISVNNSRSFSVNAVSVYNQCADNGSNAKWEYLLQKTDSSFAFFDYGQVNLIPASNSGHTTFTPFNQWIWRVLPEGRPAGDVMPCTCDLTVKLTSSRARLVAPGYTDVYNRYYPFSKKFTFNIKQAPKP